MSAPIEVLHPAPLRFVRQGCRKPEDDCVQVRTPATLATADPAAFVSLGLTVGGFYDKRDLFEHDGGVWAPLTVDLKATKLRAIRPFELRAWLSGEMSDAALASCIVHAFAGTPLAHVRMEMSRRDRNDAHASWRTTTGRGAAEGEIAVRTVIQDGQDRARRAVLDFLADRVRIVGQKVFVRVVPLARFTPLDGGLVLLDAVMRIPVQPDLVARPDRASDLVEDWSTEPCRHAEAAREVSAAIPERLLDDAPIGLLANLLPRIATGLVDGSAGLRGLDRKVHAGIRDLAEGVRADALLGEIGGVTEWEPAILRSIAVLGAIADGYPDGPEARTARRFHGFVHRRVIPQLDGPLDGADAEALRAASAMAP